MKRFAGALAAAVLALMVSTIGATISASQIDTKALLLLTDKYGVDRSGANEIVRAFRGAVNVGINPRKLEVIIEHALASTMDLKYLLRAISLTTKVALDGLPPDHMLNKFSEGLVKKADEVDIIEAMEKRALSLKEARQILSVVIYKDKPMGELEFVLVAVASALERGISDKRIKKVFKEKDANLRQLIFEIEKL